MVISLSVLYSVYDDMHKIVFIVRTLRVCISKTCEIVVTRERDLQENILINISKSCHILDLLQKNIK